MPCYRLFKTGEGLYGWFTPWWIHALEALANEVFDFIVLDLGLPKTGCLAVCLKQLRANEE